MTVLVVYGSTRGGTQGIAEMIADELHRRGLEAEVRPARDVRRLPDAASAVIVAGALSAHRWHRDARSFVRRLGNDLSSLPVWLVASGPLDDSAALSELAPVPQVARAASSVGAQGTATFGGRLLPDAKRFPASAMARTRAGDWRDPTQVSRWVDDVATALRR